MPTFARLVGAVLLGALTWFVSGLIVPLFPEGFDVGWFVEANTLVGVYIGWVFLGGRARGSISNAIGNGITTAVALVVVGLFAQCVGEMIRLSFNKQYDTAPEAIVGVFELMIDYGQMMATVEVIGTILIGTIAAAFLTEAVSHKFD